MTHAAKLVWNTSNWEFPTAQANNGVIVAPNHGGESYYYGLEEWLNNSTLRTNKIGYIDCYRASRHLGNADIILLTCSPIDGKVYHVGNMFGVEQLHDGHIFEIKNDLGLNWVNNQIIGDFTRIEAVPNPAGASIYRQNNWDTQHISATPPGGFMCNVRYDKLEIFGENNRISLTDIDPLINTRWRYLGRRFILENASFNEALNNYLNAIG